MEHQDYTCAVCGERLEQAGAELDHKVPIHLGGSNHVSNFQATHRACNRSRSYRADLIWARPEQVGGDGKRKYYWSKKDVEELVTILARA